MAAGTNEGDYFSSYTDLSVHELMLKDRPRTLAYRNFFETNREWIRDKVVMDVGAGTGILSLFAAIAGARKVYAVEASGVASLCKEIVQENDLTSVIEVIHGAVEDILLPAEAQQVDVIVSEWMGFYLLHESMLDSVIVARDRFLAPGGILVPSHARLYFAPVDMSDHFQDRADEWSNVYGFDFSPIASQMNIQEVSKPLIKCLNPDVVRSKPEEIVSLDLKTITVKDVSRICAVLKFPIECESKIHGFASWFECDFCVEGSGSCSLSENVVDSGTADKKVTESGDAQPLKTGHDTSSEKMAVDQTDSDLKAIGRSKNLAANLPEGSQDQSVSGTGQGRGSAKAESVRLSLKTGPFDPPTHWKQTVIFLPRTIMVGEGLDLCCRVNMSQDSGNKRHYNITVALIDEGDSVDDIGEDDESIASDDDGEDSDASTDHPVPCNCGSDRCRLIAALVEKYDTEHQELGEEAEIIELEAEVEAAKQLDEDIEKGGWPMDSSGAGIAMEEKCDEDQEQTDSNGRKLSVEEDTRFKDS